MALPRLGRGGLLDPLTLLGTFVAMTMLAAMMRAWRPYAAIGWVTTPARRWSAVLLAAVSLGVASWVPAMRVEAALRSTLLDDERAAMVLTDSGVDLLALLLWTAGPETVMFSGGAMCFFARLSGQPLFSAAATAFLRCWIVLLQFEAAALEPPGTEQLVLAALRTFSGCMLFAIGDLPAAVVFAIVGELHHLLRLL